jgi:hypothetical protein
MDDWFYGMYMKIEQERDWYIGAAQTMPSIDMMESIKNQYIDYLK